MSTHRHNDTFVQFTHRRGGTRERTPAQTSSKLELLRPARCWDLHLHFLQIFLYIYISRSIYVRSIYIYHQSTHGHNIFGNRAHSSHSNYMLNRGKSRKMAGELRKTQT